MKTITALQDLILAMALALECPCGAGDPCVDDDDCADGLICPTVDDPHLGIVGVCIAPCGVGCCAEDAQCRVEDGVGVCIDDAGSLGCPSATRSCWGS
jgi:hypothetical protein